MNLINNVLGDPMKTGVVFGGATIASHFFFAMDLLVTGGIGVVGAYLVWRAHNKKS